MGAGRMFRFSHLLKAFIEVVADRFCHLLFIRAFERELKLGALGSREGHDSDDRLPIDLKSVVFDKEIGLKFTGKLYDRSSRARMKPGAVFNGDCL